MGRYMEKRRALAMLVALAGAILCGCVLLVVERPEIENHDVTVITQPLPVTIENKEADGTIASVIQIDSVDYDFNSSVSLMLRITLSGTKIYANGASDNRTHDKIGYNLYESSGYLVGSGNVDIGTLPIGDSFREDVTVPYYVKPGETYRLEFVRHGW